MADVNITVDGRKLTAPAGTLLIEACKSAGIEVPSFCYYPGLSLQGACRMCLVEIAKMPKLQTACTTVIQEGMAVTTTSDTVRQARKAMLEFVLQNHPLDCPVCDAGGECELQDMTFSYGASESKLIDFKNHKEEEQWSPVVFFDRPRCILCYRCVRVCNEGMDVAALGIQNRGSLSLIVPNHDDHLECEECGMCIDICPVGALTSGAYRYKTRPWEMNHVGTICTHCGDGCKTTLGVRRQGSGNQIVRSDNRDKSGINGDFLCIKGRYAFDFVEHSERLKQPLVRKNGTLTPASWEEALELAARRFREARDIAGGTSIGVIGSNRTTNEENYLLQKFARLVLRTNNIDHHRTADYPAFVNALSGHANATASMRDLSSAQAVLLIGNDPTYQHPLLAWQIRTNIRLHGARLYVVNSWPIKLARQAKALVQIPEGAEGKAAAFLGGNDAAADGLVTDKTSREKLLSFREKLQSEQNLVVIFGSEMRGQEFAGLVRTAVAAGAKFICLGDYANSRGAADMGLYPDLLPGYLPLSEAPRFGEPWKSVPQQPGMNLEQMAAAGKEHKLRALYVVGSNPLARYDIDPFALAETFVVVEDLFLTETANVAEVVLPAACAYEKSGSFTNTCGDLQLLHKAGDCEGVKPDLEIIVRLAERMGFDIRQLLPMGPGGMRADFGESRGVQSGEADRQAIWNRRQGYEPRVSPFNPFAVLEEIQRLVPGYDVGRLELLSGNDVHTATAGLAPGKAEADRSLVPSNDNLFTSGTLGRYSDALNKVIENRLGLPNEKKEVEAD
ncbi:MAG TPA: NADH-quinone oxidoreductase subunit NuoG [Terriglobales bacterium]|nr:NADH-quinone oxidoreductase subunit NuoG [Terriglobales bacterium]